MNTSSKDQVHTFLPHCDFSVAKMRSGASWLSCFFKSQFLFEGMGMP